MDELHWWSSSGGRIEFQLPIHCIRDCSHSGRCDDDVFNWTYQLQSTLDFTEATMITELLEVGAWSKNELKDMTRFELQEKLVWIAANDISEALFCEN